MARLTWQPQAEGRKRITKSNNTALTVPEIPGLPCPYALIVISKFSNFDFLKISGKLSLKKTLEICPKHCFTLSCRSRFRAIRPHFLAFQRMCPNNFRDDFHFHFLVFQRSSDRTPKRAKKRIRILLPILKSR